jgi:UDP-2,4-diacetamido-2,4,6-trideoxy-beta-L-altropyranose hydrolase
MKVAFRVDASADIGTGHLRRCLSLGHALRQCGARSCFISRALGLPVTEQVRAERFDAVALPPPAAGESNEDRSIPHAAWSGVGAEADARQTIDAVQALRPDWLVVDHYSFDARWHRAVARATGCRIAVIDDLGDRALAAELLVDHNFAADHRQKYGARFPADGVMLVGPRHALLGPAYANAARHRVREKVGSVGIFMGGVDHADYSRMALLACCELPDFEGEVEVVTTSANPNLPALRSIVARSPKARLTLDLPDLAAFFCRHDVHVGAGGGATWERCCIGSPTIAIVAADNQRAVLEPLAGLGVLKTAEAQPAALKAALRALIDDLELRRRLSDEAQRLVDGRGARRVADYLVH